MRKGFEIYERHLGDFRNKPALSKKLLSVKTP